MIGMNIILENLKARAKQRPGMLKEFPIDFKSKIGVKHTVWVQPLYQNEVEMTYAKANLHYDGIAPNDDELKIDMRSIECLVYAYKDADTHENIFTNANDIRTNCTPDEIALLIHLLNLVTWACASLQVVDSPETALMFAQSIAESNDTAAIEMMQVGDLLALSLELSKRIEALKAENETLKEANTSKP